MKINKKIIKKRNKRKYSNQKDNAKSPSPPSQNKKRICQQTNKKKNDS